MHLSIEALATFALGAILLVAAVLAPLWEKRKGR